MKKYFSLALVLSFWMLTAQDWPQLGRYQKDNAKILEQEKTVNTVFFGDSITQDWASFNPVFFEENAFLGRGISGQTTPQLLLRFRQDVLSFQPKRVVLLAGINDIAENTGPITLEETVGNIISMAEIAKSNGIEMILCSVLPANYFPWQPKIIPALKVIDLNKRLRLYAQENDLTYVDYYSAMVDQKKGLKSELGYDTVHPNKSGFDIMEKILLKALIEKE